MEKPKPPIMPEPRDFPDAQRPLKGMTMEECEATPFFKAFRKYQKDEKEYPMLLEKWEQLKLAKIIINMAKRCEGKEDRIQKKIVEKFKIVKR